MACGGSDREHLRRLLTCPMLQSGERVTRLDDLQDIDELHVVEVGARLLHLCILSKWPRTGTIMAHGLLHGRRHHQNGAGTMTACKPLGPRTCPPYAVVRRPPRRHLSAPQRSPAAATAATPAPCLPRAAGPTAVRCRRC